MTDPARAALAELVRLKKLKDELDAWHPEQLNARYDEKLVEYMRGKPLAWAAADLALSTPDVAREQPIVHVNSTAAISSGPAKQDFPSVERIAREGYVLAPKEPTEEICMAIGDSIDWDDSMAARDIDDAVLDIYKAIIAALPTSSGIAETTREGDGHE